MPFTTEQLKMKMLCYNVYIILRVRLKLERPCCPLPRPCLPRLFVKGYDDFSLVSPIWPFCLPV